MAGRHVKLLPDQTDNFRKNLRYYIETKERLTQTAFADQISCSQSTVCRVLNGGSITAGFLALVVRYTRIPPEIFQLPFQEFVAEIERTSDFKKPLFERYPHILPPIAKSWEWNKEIFQHLEGFYRLYTYEAGRKWISAYVFAICDYNEKSGIKIALYQPVGINTKNEKDCRIEFVTYEGYMQAVGSSFLFFSAAKSDRIEILTGILEYKTTSGQEMLRGHMSVMDTIGAGPASARGRLLVLEKHMQFSDRSNWEMAIRNGELGPIRNKSIVEHIKPMFYRPPSNQNTSIVDALKTLKLIDDDDSWLLLGE